MTAIFFRFLLTILWELVILVWEFYMLKSNIDVFFVTSFLCSLQFLFFHPIEYPKRCLWKTRQSEMADLARAPPGGLGLIFDFIECFTTTFLRAHSWLNWVVQVGWDIPLHFDTNPESLRPFVPEIWPNNVFNLSATYDLDLWPKILKIFVSHGVPIRNMYAKCHNDRLRNGWDITHWNFAKTRTNTHTNRQTDRHGHYNTSPSPYGGRGKNWNFSMAQFLWYDCTFKKQDTVPVTLTFDLWRSIYFSELSTTI